MRFRGMLTVILTVAGTSYIAFLRAYAIRDSRRTLRAHVLGITSLARRYT